MLKKDFILNKTRYLLLTSRFRKKTDFVYSRLLDGLQEFARLYQLGLGKTQVRPLKKG